MGLESWGPFIGGTASICTILQMLAPLPTCYKFYVKQSVGDMVVTPYVVAMTSSSLWLLYGILVQDAAIIRVNIAGFILQLSYTVCFYIYSVKRAPVQEQITVACATMTAALLYSLIEKDHGRLVCILGVVSCCVTVLFFLSPLANIGYVIKVWNSESLPRLLILATFVVSLQWALYGYICKDKFIQITNLFGTVVSGLQLLIVLIIPSYPTCTHEKLVCEI